MEEEYLSEYKGHKIYFKDEKGFHTATSIIFRNGEPKYERVTKKYKKEAYDLLLERIDNIPAYHSMYEKE